MKSFSGFHSSVRLSLVAGALVAALIGSGCQSAESSAAAATPAPEHRVDVPALEVGLTDLESTLQISGNLVPHTRVAVMAKLPGTLSRVAVDIGGRVGVGQVVATLDQREIDAQVDAAAAAVNVARAGVESAEAGLANAVLEHERAQNLFEKGAVPRQRLDSAETARRASNAQRDLAMATLAQAEAALRRAREVQRDATLVSPIDGVVVERNYDAGSLVSPGDNKPVVVVADLRVMKLQAGVSELEAGRLRVGMTARVSVQARPGEFVEGRVAAIAPEVDARNRHFAIEVRTPNPGTLLSGMYGVATIPLQRVDDVVAVPREAIVTRGGTRVALRIENNTVAEVPVTEGLSNGTDVQIASGLKAGDTIVADARREVAAGARVNPIFRK
ncbi:MAG TPA: efflux RND transporter periplasmic adaptor subunit [Vicinamibacterales bacterium]